jgi:hypothetical protein
VAAVLIRGNGFLQFPVGWLVAREPVGGPVWVPARAWEKIWGCGPRLRSAVRRTDR